MRQPCGIGYFAASAVFSLLNQKRDLLEEKPQIPAKIKKVKRKPDSAQYEKQYNQFNDTVTEVNKRLKVLEEKMSTVEEILNQNNLSMSLSTNNNSSQTNCSLDVSPIVAHIPLARLSLEHPDTIDNFSEYRIVHQRKVPLEPKKKEIIHKDIEGLESSNLLSGSYYTVNQSSLLK